MVPPQLKVKVGCGLAEGLSPRSTQASSHPRRHSTPVCPAGAVTTSSKSGCALWAVPADNRISYGCINVPARFFDRTLLPLVRSVRPPVVYLLPETRPVATLFAR